MTSRRVGAARLAILAVSAAACGAPAPTPAPVVKPPNVVVFLVDDMGTQETSVPFQTKASELNRVYRTPAMERLAAQGVKFPQAYASAVCSPTRVSLLTGMNVARHGVTNWTLRQDTSPDNAHPTLLPPEWNVNGMTVPARPQARAVAATPLPALLRDAGYRTIHVGKAHFGAIGTPGADPTTLGFDVNVAGHAAGAPGSYLGTRNYSSSWRKGDAVWDVPGLGKYHGTDVNLTEALTREAIAEVERAARDGAPFFLHLSHYAIHAPWEDDARFRAKYDEIGMTPFQATLASMIEGMDRSLGDVLDALDRLGLAQDTVVLFLSDNGSPAQCPRNLPLRGHKLAPYEGGVRVPLLARWPGVAPAGGVVAQPVVVEDVFATVLDVAGVDWDGRVVQQVDGVSFAPALRGAPAAAAAPAPRPLVWHYPHHYSGQQPWSAIRVGDHKLVHHHADGRLELFDVVADGGEKHDLSRREPARVRELADQLGALLRDRGARMPPKKLGGGFVPFADEVARTRPEVVALTFSLLRGGGDAADVGLPAAAFGGSRLDEIAAVIRRSGADVVGLQDAGDVAPLLRELGPEWRGFGVGSAASDCALLARHPLDELVREPDLCVGRVRLPGGRSVVAASARWGDGRAVMAAAQAALRQGGDAGAVASAAFAASGAGDGARGWHRLVEALEPYLAARERVLVCADCGEGSHLDWTARAAVEGADRWVGNPTAAPLRPAVAWAGSQALAALGLVDAFRAVHPDEVARPGFTTVAAPADAVAGLPDAARVHDRADRILATGDNLQAVEATVLGEPGPWTDLAPLPLWCSDRRAVRATFLLPSAQAK